MKEYVWRTPLDWRATVLQRMFNMPDLNAGRYFSIHEDYADMARGIVKLVNYAKQHPDTTLFFLDKGARPAFQLFRATWRALEKNHTTLPSVRFINIGREKKKLQIVSEHTDAIRNRYHHIGDKILIVDTWRDPKSPPPHSLDIAQSVLQQAFPQTTIETMELFKEYVNWDSGYIFMDYSSAPQEKNTAAKTGVNDRENTDNTIDPFLRDFLVKRAHIPSQEKDSFLSQLREFTSTMIVKYTHQRRRRG